MYATSEPEIAETSHLDNLSDSDLIVQVRRGNDSALGVLLRRHQSALYRFCIHLTKDPDEAEDVCQEAMARAITRVDRLNAADKFRSWLFSIARNLSIDSHRSRQRICSLPDDDHAPIQLYEDELHNRVEASEEHQTVAEALRKLAKSHQNVLMMREVEGMSYAEIAAKLDVTQSAVETLLFRARRRLREEYGKKAAPAPTFGLLAGLRGLLSKLASPFSGAPLLGKLAISTVSLGIFAGAAVSAPHLYRAAFVSASAPAVTSPSRTASNVPAAGSVRGLGTRNSNGQSHMARSAVSTRDVHGTGRGPASSISSPLNGLPASKAAAETTGSTKASAGDATSAGSSNSASASAGSASKVVAAGSPTTLGLTSLAGAASPRGGGQATSGRGASVTTGSHGSSGTSTSGVSLPSTGKTVSTPVPSSGTVGQVTGQVQNTTGQVVSQATSTAGQASGQAQNVGGQVQNTAQNTAGQAQTTVNSTTSGATGTATKTQGSAGHAVATVTTKGQGAVATVQSTGSSKTKGATNKATGAVPTAVPTLPVPVP